MPRNKSPVPDNWDDTDLLKVWDDCVAEYKKYHSIAASGGQVERPSATIASEDDNVETKPRDSAVQSSSIAATVPTFEHVQDGANQSHGAPEPAQSGMMMPPLPPGMTEHMKALALSWYYAGYYAGVAEGYAKAWTEGER